MIRKYCKKGGKMDIDSLIGMRVVNVNTHAIGTIEYIKDGYVAIDFYGEISKYAYPSSFAKMFELEDEKLQKRIQLEGIGASFDMFKRDCRFAVNSEIEYLKTTGGKKYRIIDGEKLPSKNGEYLYAFDTDTDMHYPDGTAIKLWFPDNIVTAYVVSCEDFTILIRTTEYIGEFVESVEFTSEQWQLLESLMDRLDDMEPRVDSIAYEIACNGRKHITLWNSIRSGQDYAFNRAISEKITFIWGPPGTGKTEILSKIAIEHICKGRRVLMLSYSNVSVDGALFRIAQKADFPDGMVIRYGYPRIKELVNSKSLTSYQFVLQKNSRLAQEYQKLLEEKKKLRKRAPERLEINNRLNKIRNYLLEKEKELIHKSAFVATTVSKATVDKAIYTQSFDVVIFDEASMAYVPQVIFAAGMAKKYFVCLGDFCQLPAIVQNKIDDRLTKDIFEHIGITSAVENNEGHDWLVMLDLQYRMHQEIADFVSENMYHGRLKTFYKIMESRNEIAAFSPCKKEPMALIDLSGMYSVCTKTKDNSRINLLSAMMCMRLAEKYIGNFEVGIITPYSAQSRLIVAMLRDIQSVDKRWEKVSCATVHQFQGSEKPVIIYDAVDCYRMSYPGTLLTSMKHNTANRLFNVAVTRAKGKFVLVANTDYLLQKKISQNLIFTKAINIMKQSIKSKKGFEILDELMPAMGEKPSVYLEDREASWETFISDIQSAKKKIDIDMPDVMDDSDSKISLMCKIFNEKYEKNVEICIRHSEEIVLPNDIQKYTKIFEYVTTPITIIDKSIVWFGQPLYAADFISEGDILDTEYFPCVRFEGKYSARLLQVFFEM